MSDSEAARIADLERPGVVHWWGVYRDKMGSEYIALDTGETFVHRVDHFTDMDSLVDYANRGFNLRHYPGWRGRLARWLVQAALIDGPGGAGTMEP